MRTFFLFLMINFLAASIAFGQNQATVADSGATCSKQSTTKKIEDRFDKKITRIKINPLVILSGDMPVYLEHELRQDLSAEVSVGSTYDNVLSEAFENGNQQHLNIAREGLNSYSFSAALRHYPSQRLGALQGYYFAPEVRFRDYRSQVTGIDGGPVNVRQSRQVLDGKFVIGYINQTRDRIFFDFYGGIGMRFKNYNNRIENYSLVYDPATNQVVTLLKLKDYDKRGLLLSLGFKIGFSF